MHKIRIGGIISPHQFEHLPRLMEWGFETFSILFHLRQEYDMPKIAAQLKTALAGTNCTVSNLCSYGNAFLEDETGELVRNLWHKLVDAAELFDTDIVAGFTGRVVDKPVPDSIPKYVDFFGPLAQKAKEKNVRIAFENCDYGGNWHTGGWNIAFNPRAWELMFEALPADNIGLQWEPCHQMGQLIDPIPQLRKWAKKIFCVHAKDAHIAWDIVKEHGTLSGIPYVWHRTAGFGDSNWTEIMTILLMAGYEGTFDIEGYHDPIFRGELEFTGQVHALHYLKQCRGGVFHKNLW